MRIHQDAAYLLCHLYSTYTHAYIPCVHEIVTQPTEIDQVKVAKMGHQLTTPRPSDFAREEDASLLQNLWSMSQPSPNPTPGDPAVLQLPALEPPPGTVPNFTNAENRGAVLIIVNGTLLVVMAMFMVIRVYTKSVIIRKLSWDDLTISFSAFGAFALCGFLVWGELVPFCLPY